MAGRWYPIRCWGHLRFSVETVGWFGRNPTLESFSLKFDSRLYATPGGDDFWLCAFIAFDFVICNVFSAIVVYHPMICGIWRPFWAISPFCGIELLCMVFHRVCGLSTTRHTSITFCPFWAFLSHLFWDGYASLCRIWLEVYGIDFVYDIDDSAVYGFDLPYCCICRIDDSAVLRL